MAATTTTWETTKDSPLANYSMQNQKVVPSTLKLKSLKTMV